MYDTAWEAGFIGAGGMRPFGGNPTAPNGTIAFGYATACWLLYGGRNATTMVARRTGSFIVYNTANVGSNGTARDGSNVRTQPA